MNYDRLILGLIDRVSALEGEVEYLKSVLTKDEANKDKKELIIEVAKEKGRDTTKYILDGKKYGKNRLVLRIVQKYMLQNPNTSTEKLQVVFDKSLQGSLGVVRSLEDVKNVYADYERRFFTTEDEQIHTTDGIAVVCTQWGYGNIDGIIKRAEQLGMSIEIIK